MPQLQKSVVHSSIGGREIKALDNFPATGYRSLRRIGIQFSDQDIADMAALDSRQNRMVSAGMDAIQGPVTTPNAGIPVQFLQAFVPGYVHIATAVREIDEIVGVATVGEWEDDQIVQGILENLGLAVPYGDLTDVPLTSYQLSFEQRTVVRYESGLRVGRLEEARAARVQVNSAGEKRASCTLALEIQRNLVGFYGYNGGYDRTYGFLNDPNLPSYVTVPVGASGYTQWSRKTALEIDADLRTAFAQLRTQSQGLVKPEQTRITVVLPTNAVDRLSVNSDFGYSVRKWLTDNYAGVRIVSAPQLNTANGGSGVFYVFAESIADGVSTDDTRTFMQVVPARVRMLGAMPMPKGFEEDYSNATAGVMCKRPYLVVRYSGIS